MSTLTDELRADPPRAPERLREQVAALAATPVAARPAFRLPRPRRFALVLVPASLALAVAAALVHGLTRSDETRRAVPVVAHGSVTLRAAAPEKAPAPVVGAAPGAPYRALNPLDSAARAARLQRYEASLRVRVRDERRLAEATREATRTARALGGYAYSVQFRTPQNRPGQAFLELRIPAQRVQAAVARLSELGTLVSQRISILDLQRTADRQAAQIAQLRRAIGVYVQALRDPSLTPVSRAELRIKLGEARRALAQRTHAHAATIAEGSLARVSLVLTTARPAAAAAHRSDLHRRLDDAVSFLAVEATVLLYVLIVVAPLALLAAATWWVARTLRRREERRLLSA